MAVFNHFTPGHRAAAAAVLSLSLASWVLMLAGVASLQSACDADLGVGANDIDQVTSLLHTAQALVASMNPAGPAPTLTIMQTFAALLQAQADMAHRSVAVFTITPDSHCAMYYRYQWLSMSLQAVVLLLAVTCCTTNFLYQARVAVCCLLSVSTVLALENANTFFHVRLYAPDLTLARGKLFFAGCIATSACNLFLLVMLGTHEEAGATYVCKEATPAHKTAPIMDDADQARKVVV